MTIDPKYLIPLVLSEFQMGGTFYRKDLETEFSKCDAPTAVEFENWSIHDQIEYRELTKQYSKEGRLFLFKDNPWGNMFDKIKRI